MITVIAKRELKDMWRDGRFAWSALLFLLLFSAAAITGWQRAESVAAERAVAQEIVFEQWLNQGEKNPHSAAHYGIYAFKPLGPLAYFDTAVTNFTGVSIWLEAHKQNRAKDRPAADMTSLQRFGDLTGAFVLQMLLPLMTIFLAFNAFAGERETGTLRQLMSMGVAPQTLLIGKGLGILMALALMLLPIIAIGLFLLGGLTDTDLLLRILGMLGIYSLYTLIFLGLSLTISAIARSSQVALISLVTFWLISAFVIPRLGAEVANSVTPLPNSITFADSVAADTENGIDGIGQSQRLSELRDKTLERYQVDTVEDLPLNIEGLSFTMMEKMGDAVFDKHYGDLQSRFGEQQNTLQGFSLLSPLIAVQTISSAFAGTSMDDHNHFANEAEQFRRMFVQKMNDDLTFNAKSGETSYKAGNELWEVVSAFDYVPRDFITTLLSVLPSILILITWTFLAGISALLAVERISRGGVV